MKKCTESLVVLINRKDVIFAKPPEFKDYDFHVTKDNTYFFESKYM